MRGESVANKDPLKIDVFAHILPLNFKKVLLESLPPNFSWKAFNNSVLSDLESRFKIMDQFDGITPVLSLPPPPVEHIANPEKAADLAKMANDEMAELVLKYPERFAAAIACLPMNDMDNSLREVDRAIKDLNLKGVQIYSPTNHEALGFSRVSTLYKRCANMICRYSFIPLEARSPRITRRNRNQNTSYIISSAGPMKQRRQWPGWSSAACLKISGFKDSLSP